MEELERRIFLKQVALASAAAVAGSLAPGLVFGEEVWISDGSADGVVWKKAPCPFCGVGCGLLVGVRNGRAVAVKGDPASPVNRGLACAKGYHSVLSLYARDRITKAKVRRGNRMVEVPIAQALDVVARRIEWTTQRYGKDSVAIYGSGQWTIPAGYVAVKLFKGGLGTNNVEASTRLGMSSAVSGLLTSFGLDEPMGCYEDIDHADVFVLWGNNMAETHPVLFSRILERRQRRANVLIVELATRATRTSHFADRSLVFLPQTDLAVANAICHEIVARNWVNRDFVARHVAFKKGKTGIGYGLGEALSFTDEVADATWEEYVRFLDQYTPERVAGISGLSASEIRWLASLYGDPSRKVMSLWCAGVNQHTRGTWLNNLLYNIHLLVGKVASPGNSPFSLSGQPSACGTVREVGTLTERLPRGVVTNPEDRRLAAEIWNVPVENISPHPTWHAVQMFDAFERGDIRFMWIQGANPMVTLPNLDRYRKAAANGERFLVVSDVYPTATTDVADVVLPSALWIEQEGLFGNSERRTQHFERMLTPPGEAMSDAWQLIDVARRLGFGRLFPWKRETYVLDIWEEYARFRDTPEDRLAPLEELKARPGVMWPYVDGRETKWRYNTRYDPAADRRYGGFDFYGHPDHRAWIWLRPYEPPPEPPDDQYPFWLATGRVLEHWLTGSLTRRIPVLHRAVPRAYAELNPQDAEQLGVRDGDFVRLVSRRGSLVIQARVDYRARPPQGQIFVPFFDESLPINELTLDAYCPISGEPDYKKCKVRVEPMGSLRPR